MRTYDTSNIDMSYGVSWPAGFDRTPESERESTSKFTAGIRQSKREIKTEMQRLDAEKWRLEDESGSGGDPGVVLRWRKDGRDHAVACDAYTSRSSNLRAVYLWVNETRLRSQRPVETGQDEFAAARLPSGEEDVIVSGDGTRQEPHEVLGVAPDAPDDVIRASARTLASDVHPDTSEGGDTEAFKRIQRAKRRMLGEES